MVLALQGEVGGDHGLQPKGAPCSASEGAGVKCTRDHQNISNKRGSVDWCYSRDRVIGQWGGTTRWVVCCFPEFNPDKRMVLHRGEHRKPSLLGDWSGSEDNSQQVALCLLPGETSFVAVPSFHGTFLLKQESFGPKGGGLLCVSSLQS